MGEISSDLDHDAHILTIRVIGEVKDAEALREIPLIWSRHAETRDYDSIVDLLRDEGSISWEAIISIGAKWNDFAKGRDAGRRSAIVIRNEHWTPLVKAIAALFPSRRFAAFRTIEEARHWLLSAPA